MKEKKYIGIDYHFHPNLPKGERSAEEKIREDYRRFLQNDVKAVIVTEHVYKSPSEAYSFMVRFRPRNFYVFPGMEYVTREGLDMVIFSDSERIYHYKELLPFKLTYEETIFFVKKKNLYAYVTHPFTLGTTSVYKKMGASFTKKTIRELGAVEEEYTGFSELKHVLNHPVLSVLFKKIIKEISWNEHVPMRYRPEKIRFIATGSDAHFPWDIGTHMRIAVHQPHVTRRDVFKLLTSNRVLDVVRRHQTTFFEKLIDLAIVFKEHMAKIEL